MATPDPTRSATRVLGCALGMAALAGACSKQERPDLALRQSTLAAQTPATPAAPADTADNRFLNFDAATNTVTFMLVAGPFVFDGFGNGQATLTVPPKSNVWFNFVQEDGTPHSAEVHFGRGPVPNSGGNPRSRGPTPTRCRRDCLREPRTSFSFTAPDSGKFRIICGVPGHACGMWIWLKVDPAAKTASFGPTKS